MRNIPQNLFFAFIYDALGVPIAAGALYPFVGLLLNPLIADAQRFTNTGEPSARARPTMRFRGCIHTANGLREKS